MMRRLWCWLFHRGVRYVVIDDTGVHPRAVWCQLCRRFSK
jgi:hypothetical protein